MSEKFESYEKNFDFKHLLIRILYYWRTILIGALVFMLLIGGYKFYSLNNLIKNIDVINEQERSYQVSKDLYVRNKETLESDISNIEESIKKQKSYNENSILMKIDPFNEYKGYISYYIKTDYKILPNMVYQNIDNTNSILQTYILTSLYGDMYDYLIENLNINIDSKFLKELIKINGDRDTKIINIDIISNEPSLCLSLFNLIQEYFDKKQTSIANDIGEHSIICVENSLQTIIDLDLDTIQKNNISAITKYENRLAEKKSQMHTMVPAAKTVITYAMIIKSAVKYAALGLFIGVILVMGMLLLYILISDKVIDANEFRNRYRLKVLGMIESTKNEKRLFGFVDNLIRKIEGKSNYKLNEKDQIKILSSNLKAICSRNKLFNCDIYFTGTVDSDEIKTICNLINDSMEDFTCNIIIGENINKSVHAIDQLEGCDAVIIVEKIGSSNYNDVSRLVESINDREKNVIGTILI